MKKNLENFYFCPFTRKQLTLNNASMQGDSVSCGELVCAENSYEIKDGIPNFIRPDHLTKLEIATQHEYDLVAEEFYDTALDWLFASYYENEDDVSERMLDPLKLSGNSKVLEVGCGTGRDSFRIARRLGKDGVFFLQDLSPKMVEKTKELFARHVYQKIQYRLRSQLLHFECHASAVPRIDISTAFFILADSTISAIKKPRLKSSAA